jgi:FdhD protein
VSGPLHAVTDVRGVKVRPDGHVELPDRLATEEPLEIRAAGPGQEQRAVAVTMRTPGHDFELAAGFLVTEGLIRPEQIAGVAYCSTAEPEHRWNTVTVALRVPWDHDALRRDFVATSSCGVCGKAGIDQVELACPVLGAAAPVPATLIPLLPDRLRAAQRVFDRTGGLHAAGSFDRSGDLPCVREDVGRHNAVDKLVGHGALQRAAGPSPAPQSAGGPRTRHDRSAPAADVAGMVVSGRVSFEIVQKAAMAGLAVIAAVSAPSSLAVQAAERLGVTIAAFVRNGTYTLYSHPERIDLDA